MKKTYLIFFLVLSTSAFSQVFSERTWTIQGNIATQGLTVYNISEFEKNFRINFFNGLAIKKKLNLATFKVGFETYNFGISSIDEVINETVIKPEEYVKHTLIKIGIEKGVLIAKKVKPYIGIDVVVNFSAIELALDSNQNGSVATKLEQSYNSIGIAPIFGIEVYLLKFLSLEANTKLYALKHFVSVKDDNLVFREEVLKKIGKSSSFWQPLGMLALNIKFP